MKELKRITMYTDGACIGNPGPGGYGVVLLYANHRKELSGGCRRTTNNRMELMAVIIGLKALGLKALNEQCRVTLHSDSEYVVKAMTEGWAHRWQANGWKRNKKEKVVNPDLWAQLLLLCEQHEVEFRWVRGHAGDPENERCDHLAAQAAQQTALPIDSGYESSEASAQQAL